MIEKISITDVLNTTEIQSFLSQSIGMFSGTLKNGDLNELKNTGYYTLSGVFTNGPITSELYSGLEVLNSRKSDGDILVVQKVTTITATIYIRTYWRFSNYWSGWRKL